MSQKRFNRAVVAGAGIGGLAAARVLSDFFEEVLIIEKAELPDKCGSRKSLPQGFHNHSLLEGGRHVLEKFFPGFCEELVSRGNWTADQAAGLKWFHHDCWKIREPIDRIMHIQSRWHLEGLLREKVRGIENVRFITSGVQGFAVSAGRLEKVRTDKEDIEADLLIDATGRGSQLPNWLKAAGLNEPKTVKYTLGLHYSSFLFRRKEEDNVPDWKILAVYPDPPKGSGSGVVFPVMDEEHGPCWLVSMIGRNGESPGVTYDEILEFAGNLPQPDIYEFIKGREPLTDKAAVFAFKSSQRNRYEKLKDLPAGVLPLGDSWGRINPIYGQGMSIALMEADILLKSLSSSDSIPKAGKKYLKQGSKFFAVPWMLICCEDWRYPEVENPPPGLCLVNAYSRKLHRLGSIDKNILRDVYDVLNFRRSPLILYKPSTAVKVLFKKVQSHSALNG